MIERMRHLARAVESFAFETIRAGRTHGEFLRRCRSEGWRVTLLYLWLPSPEAAIERVARRMREGGHDIPSDVIVRRYWKGIANMLTLYLAFADITAIYDNSDASRILVAERKPSGLLIVQPRVSEPDRAERGMTDLTADEILAAIDRALLRVSSRLAADDRAREAEGNARTATRIVAKPRRKLAARHEINSAQRMTHLRELEVFVAGFAAVCTIHKGPAR